MRLTYPATAEGVLYPRLGRAAIWPMPWPSRSSSSSDRSPSGPKSDRPRMEESWKTFSSSVVRCKSSFARCKGVEGDDRSSIDHFSFSSLPINCNPQYAIHLANPGRPCRRRSELAARHNPQLRYRDMQVSGVFLVFHAL